MRVGRKRVAGPKSGTELEKQVVVFGRRILIIMIWVTPQTGGYLCVTILGNENPP